MSCLDKTKFKYNLFMSKNVGNLGKYNVVCINLQPMLLKRQENSYNKNNL